MAEAASPASGSSATAGCPFLAAPGELQDAIARLLPSEDRQRLAATCSTFHRAAWVRRWITVVKANVGSFREHESLRQARSKAAALAAWLVAHPDAKAHIDTAYPATVLAALPTAQVARLKTRSKQLPPASGLEPFSQLTRLEWSKQIGLRADWSCLAALPQLQHLSYRTRCTDSELYLHHSQLQRLGTLTGLTRLDMEAKANAGLTDAWDHALGGLTRLQHLVLVSCLSGFPAGAARLAPSLTRLDLRNMWGVGWEHLAALRQLRHLELHSCRLTEVPAAISELEGLTWLDMQLCSSLTGGWDNLLPLQRLQHLAFDNWYWGESGVPASVSELGGLTRLDIRFCGRMISGWQHLEPLQRLQHLTLNSHYQAMLQGSLSSLQGLTHLNLSSSHWLGGWHHLWPMQRLQVLQLNSCRLTEVPHSLGALSSLAVLDLEANPSLSAESFTRLVGMPSLRHVCVLGCECINPHKRHGTFLGWLAGWLPYAWVPDWLPAELAALRAAGVEVHVNRRPQWLW